MSKLAAGFAALAISILTLPLFVGPGSGATDQTAAPHVCGQLAVILDTIRTLESGGNYQAQAANATASGAYQYIDSTWRHWASAIGINTLDYPTARSAPDQIQDQVAANNVTVILDDHSQDVTIVPIAWYLPAALTNPALLDQIPAGNTLTIREYQTRWLDTYNTKLAETEPTEPDDTEPDGTGCNTTTLDGTWALPAPRDQLSPGALDNPHHDYPALDLLLPVNTPVYAITAGTVVTTQHWNGNWYSAGCAGPYPPTGCSTCGNGVTIETVDGLRHTYCHNNRLHVNNGDSVAAGQHIADSGNTGRSGTPHLHLELRTGNTRRCPQPLVTAIYNNTPIPDPTTLPTTGCDF